MDGRHKCCYWCKYSQSCSIERKGRIFATPPPCKDKFAWSATAKSWNFKKKK